MGYDKIIRMVVWRYGKTQEDREDYEQECRAALLEKQEKLKGVPETYADKYVYTVCKNAILKYIAGSQNDKTVSLFDKDIRDEIEKNSQYPDGDRKIDSEIVVQFLDKLPPPYPEVLRRKFGIGTEETQAELGKRLGVNSDTIRRWETKGLELLKKRMKL
jgi:RNA polymerase sigma factor (sigma-70 family)